MQKNDTTNTNNYLDELAIRFQREGIEYGEPDAERLPVLLGGTEIGIITAGGAICIRKEHIDDADASDLYHKAGMIADEVHEYKKLMGKAPPLKVQSLDAPYKLLADFNGCVLGGMESKQGVQFTTWLWTYDNKGLTLGHYCGNDYTAAKKDFALRTGLVQEEKQFTPDQLIEIYRCCADTVTHDYNLTYEQEKRIDDIQSQIIEMVPDHIERFKKALEQDATSLQSGQSM